MESFIKAVAIVLVFVFLLVTIFGGVLFMLGTSFILYEILDGHLQHIWRIGAIVGWVLWLIGINVATVNIRELKKRFMP